jgi:16S rRNA (guanine527-N7)-methyltransferase
MTNPDVQFTGIDSIKKKTLAVNEMISSLQITNATVLRSRIEECQKQTFDYVVARAVAYVDKLFPRAFPLVKKGGMLILMKQNLKEERAALIQLCQQGK